MIGRASLLRLTSAASILCALGCQNVLGIDRDYFEASDNGGGSWNGAVHTAPSCERADVEATIDLATDGDVVKIPEGTCAWDTKLTIIKGIALVGAGIDKTIIVDEVPRAPGTDVVLEWVAFEVDFRLSGITFVPGSITDINWTGLIILSGSAPAFRVDHLKLDRVVAHGLRIYGNLRGVIDHCEFNEDHHLSSIAVSHGSWDGLGDHGDNSWAAPTELGTDRAIYVEDNKFVVPDYDRTSVIDGWGGARFVVRHNEFTRAAISAAEAGYYSLKRNRGARQFEIYDNTFVNTELNEFTPIEIGGGTGVVFNNTFKSLMGAFRAVNYRSGEAAGGWGLCDGTGPYDGNTGAPGGYPCVDQVGRGQGDLLQGDPASPVAWPNQAAEPVYIWDNDLRGAAVGSASGVIEMGRDVIEAPAPDYEPYKYPHPLARP